MTLDVAALPTGVAARPAPDFDLATRARADGVRFLLALFVDASGDRSCPRTSATVDVRGHAGYYAGMNGGGVVTVHGSVGVGVAENMMSGTLRVRGDASQSAGATGHGGLLVIEGSASMRCGISMKGIDIVVGDIGPMSAFMAQAGRVPLAGTSWIPGSGV